MRAFSKIIALLAGKTTVAMVGVPIAGSVFGTGPTFSSSGQQTAPGEADFAVFKGPDIEIALTSLPWVDEPLLFLDTDDIEQTREALIGSGASGVVEAPGARLAVVRLANGNLLCLRQSMVAAW
jgi:hypothetical protein